MRTHKQTAALAAAFSFVIPGAGLWYIGKKRWALLNLVAVTLLIALLGWRGPVTEQIHYVILAAAAGSAGLAHAMAGRQGRGEIDSSAGVRLGR